MIYTQIMELEMHQKGQHMQDVFEDAYNYQNKRHIIPAGPTIYFEKASSSFMY